VQCTYEYSDANLALRFNRTFILTRSAEERREIVDATICNHNQKKSESVLFCEKVKGIPAIKKKRGLHNSYYYLKIKFRNVLNNKKTISEKEIIITKEHCGNKIIRQTNR